MKSLFKRRTKRVSQNKEKGKKAFIRKKGYSKSRKIVNRKISYSSSSFLYSSIIIFAGFICLSLTIFFLSRQLKPVIKNERLKYLCTYQLGDKKNQRYRDAKLQLEKLVGDSDKYCKDFLLPKEKNNKGFRFFPIIKDIFFRFI